MRSKVKSSTNYVQSMLKKDLYANVYILTALVLTGVVTYYVFVLQKEITNPFNQDTKVVQVSANQSTPGQQIVKSAMGMRYAESQRNFDFFRDELRRIYPQWQKGYMALINGDLDLNLSQSSQEELKFLFFDMNSNTANILDVKFTENKADVNFLSLQRFFEALANTIRKYTLPLIINNVRPK